jgi:TonB family protein
MPGLTPEMPFAESRVVVAAPALLIEARFRDVPLSSRLLRTDETRAFTVGAARGVDAPVNPAYLPAAASLPGGGHALIEPVPGGFALNLAPAMRAELQTPVQALQLRPDFGRAEAPLALPPDARVHVACGEVAFDIYAAEPAAVVPPPRFGADLREGGRYTAGVALAFLALLLIVRAIPEDPRSLAWDDLKKDRLMDHMVTIPLTVDSPEVTAAIANKAPGGGGAPAAKGEAGKAGDKHEQRTVGRRAVAGRVDPKDAQDAAGAVRKNTLLAVLDGPMSGSAAEVFERRAALGPDAETVLGNLVDAPIAAAYGVGGIGLVGTGEGGGGTGQHTLGAGGLGTLGVYGTGIGPGNGPGIGYGRGVKLGTRHATTPDVLPGVVTAQGALDKEIIRRIVRRHLNEVKYCYDQALVRQPKLDGRMVAKFTISGTGQVVASFVASSTLGSPGVEMCVANAIKRWEFPAPRGGGLAIVSYPFTFSPAGN